MKYRVLIEVTIEAPDKDTAESWAWSCLRGDAPDELEFADWVAITATIEEVKDNEESTN